MRPQRGAALIDLDRAFEFDFTGLQLADNAFQLGQRLLEAQGRNVGMGLSGHHVSPLSV